MRAAGYEITEKADSADIAIVLDEQGTNAGAREIIRLRSLPDQQASTEEARNSIYRYDREALLKALRAAGRGGAA